MVSRFDVDKAKSIKKVAKQSLTQLIRQKAGISMSDESGSGSESGDGEGEAGSSGTGTGELNLQKDTRSDGLTDRDVTLRGKPVLENGEDGDPAAAKPPSQMSPSVWFRLHRKKGGERQCKAQVEKGMEQGNTEMGEVPQGTDKRGAGGFGLSSREWQVTPADAVLAKVRRIFPRSH